MNIFSQFAYQPPPSISLSPTEGLIQMILFIVLFIFIAVIVYFFRMIIRFYLSKNQFNKHTWHWDIKQVFIGLIKFIAYFVILLALWSIVSLMLSGFKLVPLSFDGTIAYNLEEFKNAYSVTFIVCAVVWALVAPFVIYLWQKSKNSLTKKPKAKLHINLIILSIVIFIVSGIFFANIVSSQPYWDFIINTGIYNYEEPPHPSQCIRCVY